MADNHPRVVKNSKAVTCQRCGGVHEFLTRLSDDAYCDVPVAFSQEKALRMANLIARGPQDVVPIPVNIAETVVLDDSARKLPKGEEVQLAQFSLISQPM